MSNPMTLRAVKKRKPSLIHLISNLPKKKNFRSDMIALDYMTELDREQLLRLRPPNLFLD
jgi:hypothetical protein